MAAVVSSGSSRRERNKQAKLDRIVAAAGELFARHGVDEVTTQQVAAAADIGAGTLFLYAKTKGELLLMVQNAAYEAALEEGRAAAEPLDDTVDALLAMLAPIVRCNRKQVENGRTYLREIVFGDPGEPHHGRALAIVAQTEQAIASIFLRRNATVSDEASTMARIMSAVMFLSLSNGANTLSSVDKILSDIRSQVDALASYRGGRPTIS